MRQKSETKNKVPYQKPEIKQEFQLETKAGSPIDLDNNDLPGLETGTDS